MTTIIKNMPITKTATPVSLTEQTTTSEPVEVFTFGADKGSFASIARNVLVLDLTGSHLKYSLFVKRGPSTRWLEAGEIQGLSLRDQDHQKSINAGLEIIGSRLNLKSAKILLITEGTGFFLRRLKIPELKGNALAEAVRWTCAKQIPYPIEDACLNILNIEKISGLLQVQVAVVKKESLDKFSFLGRKLLGVVPSPLALGGNYLKQSHAQDTIDILIHWGDFEGVIDFVHGGCFEFSNNFKLEKNISESQSILSVANTEKIETNLKNSLDFYYSVYPGQQINRIVLPGDSPRETIERINRITQIDTQSESPFGQLVENQEILNRFQDINSGKYMLCAGAVKLDTKYQYLPSSLAKLSKYQKLKAAARIAAIVLAASLILLGWLFFTEREGHLREIEAMSNNISRIESSAAYTEALRLEDSVNKAILSLSRFKPSSVWVSSLLRAVSISIPSGVYFNQMHLSENGVNPGNIEISIEGYYFGELDKADVRLAELVENLNRYCGFTEDKIERLGERFEGSNKYINFSMTGSARTN